MEKFYILKIPFIGKGSILLKRRLTRLFKEYCNVKLTCVFVSCKVRQFFSLKCKSSGFLRSNVVYMFRCKHDASKFYIGETKRHLGIRVEEHLKTNGLSYVAQHIKECDGCKSDLSDGKLTFKDFSVIKTGQSKFDISILEALMIKKLNPSLNCKMIATSYMLKVFN